MSCLPAASKRSAPSAKCASRARLECKALTCGGDALQQMPSWLCGISPPASEAVTGLTDARSRGRRRVGVCPQAPRALCE